MTSVVKDSRTTPLPLPWALAAVLAALVASAASPPPADGSRSIRLADAAEQGTFNVGAAHGSLSRPDGRSADGASTPADEPYADAGVLRFDYTLPPGTAAGLWAKRFPKGLDPGGVDVVRAAVRSADAGQAQPVTALEIKGTAGTQRIPLETRADWRFVERPIDWKAIGTPTEVVVAFSRTGEGNPVAGSALIVVRFDRLSWLQKASAHPLGRIAMVAMAGLAAALLAGLLRFLSRLRTAEPTEAREDWPRLAPETAATWRQGLARDLVQGVGTVAIAGLAIAVYALGEIDRMEAGWLVVGLALAGGVVAGWWKFGLTGKRLTAGEAFLDVFATGLLAAAASPLSILQAPASWSELLMLSQPVAATAVLLYHAANAIRLATAGRHLGTITGGMIVGTPLAVGSLVLLEPGGLVQALGGALALGTLAAQPEAAGFVGRVAVLFAFNEVLTGALGLATRRTVLRSAWAHVSLLAVAVAAVAGPWIAALGSLPTLATWPNPLRLAAVVAATILSQAGLWAEVYLLTGMVLDAIHGTPPSKDSAVAKPLLGLKKGMVYSGTFMAGLSVIALLAQVPAVRRFAAGEPLVLATLFGALVFPLVKTVIETFDGSHAFFQRVRDSYRSPILYLRGAVVGLGVGGAFSQDLPQANMARRVLYGLGVGVAAYAGINLLRDAAAARSGRGRLQSWRVYFVHALLGGFIGGAVGFYFDAIQVAQVVAKFHRYVDPGQEPRPYPVYPLLSKWGFIRLGDIGGGASLLLAEALAGVIQWSIPAWLFAINRTFMAAYFDRDVSPIRSLLTRAGLVQLVENMIGVLRWGLWMSPIIESFLRKMGEPTWYNQDGAVRTLVAIVHDATTDPSSFREWSLNVFIALLAYDWVRVMIWLDHFGLRVSTLVNLSFLGMDRLDRRLSRFLGPAATARCIPEGVKRFTTWAPLLIPFYLPMGRDWDFAWKRAEALRAAAGHETLIAALGSIPVWERSSILAGCIVASTAVFSAARVLNRRGARGAHRSWMVENADYQVTLKSNGEILSRVKGRDYDVSRRSYDTLDPAGRALFLVDVTGGTTGRAWPIVGNVPGRPGEASWMGRDERGLAFGGAGGGMHWAVEVSLPSAADTVELWSIRIENLSESTRRLKIVPYLEWVLNRPDADRGHTQYNRLFAEVEYVHGLHAVLAWDKHSKAMGILASGRTPEGFLSSRMDFIGRARSLGTPRVLETLAFFEACDTDAHPTFDPIGSLLVDLAVPARGSAHLRLLIGMAPDKQQAIDLVARHLQVATAEGVSADRRRKEFHPTGHGEVPPGTPGDYCEFPGDGRRMLVRTPFTTRPFDHTLSNGLGHVVSVTNRGLHTSASVNSQQNRLTPDWADTVTREVPSEAFYLYDPDSHEWYSPTYHPLNDAEAEHEAEFGVDGSATFRMTRGTLETELTVFVPPDDPAGVYRLVVRNRGRSARRLRVAPYFQIVLAGQPEFSGPLKVRGDGELNALFFENPRNTFRTGPAFVAMSVGSTLVETERGRFFGAAGNVARPYLVEHGLGDPAPSGDDRPIAAFLAELDIPAGGESTVVVVLGQADDRARAEEVIRTYRVPGASAAALDRTRHWWLSLMDTVAVRTSRPEFDRYLDWLKYQALAERIWARRGFYQASGAYGFRDQLQDSVNLLWVDPVLARRQILLHGAQQFLEGDVVHWFHLLQDGRTGFAGRTHASDNLLWLAWGVAEYLGATGDESLLDERTAYLESDLPFPPLPAGKQGMGFDPLRSTREDSIYRHCLRAIDLVLERRMGVHGLPLMGTGDWNDGLDEIGSEGKGESVWLGFFLYYILDRMTGIIERRESPERHAYYVARLGGLKDALEATWRDDRYLRAFHDDGTEIGVKGSGVWEIDALTAAWAVMSGINPARGRIVFETALGILEQEKTILLGWPPLREDTKPYLGRSSRYPEGVRENGMYCHGVQWLAGAARRLAEQAAREGRPDEARRYADTALRLWWKVSAIPHAVPGEIETYGGQPNKQAADLVTTFEPGRMIWNGYTGAAGWVFRQALEGVLGLRLVGGEPVPPAEPGPSADLTLELASRDLSRSPLPGPPALRPPAWLLEPEKASNPT
jgi:cyclic beta-1,2-glucan synthetase